MSPRANSVAYKQSLCRESFPGTSGEPRIAETNGITGGWELVKTSNVFWTAGELDPVC
jgi:hypothetical protein